MNRYLTVADLIRINNRMVLRWGGLPGLRDGGLLESAVSRPQTGYYADVIEEAAALYESLLQTIHSSTETNGRPLWRLLFFFAGMVTNCSFGSRNAWLADVSLPDRQP